MSRRLRCRECGKNWASSQGSQLDFRNMHIERHDLAPPWPKGKETTYDTWKPMWDAFMRRHFETEKDVR